MTARERKIECFNSYIKQIEYYGFRACDISDKQWKNIEKYIAVGVKHNEILGFIDTSVNNNGKTGLLFSEEKVYVHEMMQKPEKIWYDDIESIRISKKIGKSNAEQEMTINLKEGEKIILRGHIDKMVIKSLLDELIDIDCIPTCNFQEIETNKEKYFGAVGAGVGIGGHSDVVKNSGEEKFVTPQGHGFAAERANNMWDCIKGHQCEILGDDNARNGPDRIVDGIYIQSKYCATGSRCIQSCFKDGKFRYIMDNGKPMQIEVPSDNYEAAVKAMQRRITKGQVPGIDDPKDARKIIRKGHFTYAQAKNIARAGTIESLTYDAANGAVIATSAFGVTSIITFATSIWNGEDIDYALKAGIYSGLKVGGTAFVASILSGQLLKAGLNHALIGSSEAIIRFMGPKASAVLINAFRSGKPIYGAAAMRSAAKFLRGNIITSSITVVILSSADVVNIFRGRISGKQLFKNFLNTAGTVTGGTLGSVGGAAIGSVVPVVGTTIGAIVGGVVGGGLAGKVTNAATGYFIEDDAEKMVQILQDEFFQIAKEYLLNQKEAEKSVDTLSDKLNGKILKNMFASENRAEFARNLIVPIVEHYVSLRTHIEMPDDEAILTSLKQILEIAADTEITESLC